MRVLIVVGLLLVALGPIQAATITNPGFETGNLTGWTADPAGNGSVSAVSSFGAWTAAQGSYFALIQSPNLLNSEASTLAQTVTLNQGDKVSFDYFFTNTLIRSVASVSLVGNPDIAILDLSGRGDDTSSGVWLSATSDPVTVAGTYEIYAAASNDCGLGRSTLGLDAFCVNGAPTPPSPAVPEPLTMLGLFMGIGGTANYIRKRF